MEAVEASLETGFTEMSDEEFFAYIREEIAEAADITPQQVRELTPSQIERRIEVERGEPLERGSAEQGSRYYSPLLDNDPVTREEYERREEVVEAILDPDRNPERLKWRYRAEDTYDALASTAREGRYFLEETVEFARDIRSALNPRE